MGRKREKEDRESQIKKRYRGNIIGKRERGGRETERESLRLREGRGREADMIKSPGGSPAVSECDTSSQQSTPGTPL